MEKGKKLWKRKKKQIRAKEYKRTRFFVVYTVTWNTNHPVIVESTRTSGIPAKM